MLRRIGYFLRRALQSVRQSPVVQLVSISTIAVALLVLAGFLTLLYNVDRLSARWGQEVRLVVFLADDADAVRLAALQAHVAGWPEVAAVRTRTRAEAYEAFKASLGADGAVLDGIGPDLMPASLEVTLRPEHQEEARLEQVAAKLRATPGLEQVEDVAYGRDILQRLRALRDLLRLGGLVVGGLVALAVIFIVSNTVRLALFARREEVEIMQLVGATDRFIRGPFYVEGALQGLLGGAAAVGLLWAVYRFLMPPGVDTIRLDLGQIPIDFLPASAAGGLVLGAGVVGVLASHVSVTRFLRARRQ